MSTKHERSTYRTAILHEYLKFTRLTVQRDTINGRLAIVPKSQTATGGCELLVQERINEDKNQVRSNG